MNRLQTFDNGFLLSLFGRAAGENERVKCHERKMSLVKLRQYKSKIFSSLRRSSFLFSQPHRRPSNTATKSLLLRRTTGETHLVRQPSISHPPRSNDDCKGSRLAFQEKSQMRTPCLFTQLFLLTRTRNSSVDLTLFLQSNSLT